MPLTPSDHLRHARNAELFRSWLKVDDKTKYEIIYMDLKGDNKEIFQYLKGFY